ncbi:MAG TPA: hypothetical protein DCL61_22245 [Cyanobacteria bacterium UBA12227]|nr:hypothetical protein [Cyanobacteria bacterium UBA12227]HAX88378.1 hypothetical protein [Cyanobacteria bacterium UBA11370]HBY76361.1 hypothetical protein [Cyanobacteria bacterium UBA11148]
MTVQNKLSSKFYELLAGINFEKRYYEYYENCRGREKMAGYNRQDCEAVLASTSLEFKYYKKENFFSHKQVYKKNEFILNVAFPYSTVELIFSVKAKDEVIGGPFSLLARQVAQLREPNFEYSPPYPKIRFSNLDELQEAVKFGISLFEDVKQVILSDNDWND